MATKGPGIERKAVRPHELARLLGVSKALAYRWCQTGVLRVIRIGRCVLIPVAEVERVLQGEAPR